MTLNDKRMTDMAQLLHKTALMLTLLLAVLQAAISIWKKADLYEALEGEGVPAGPINRVDEVFADPQVVARGMRIERDGLPGIASPIVIDGERMVSDRPSPRRPANDA